MAGRARNGQAVIAGDTMEYVSFGYGKRNFVIIPGLSDGLAGVNGKALMLSRMYKCFIDDFKVYIFSRRKNLPREYTIKQMADDQAEALSSLGIEKACVMGVSQGGMISQLLAAGYPGLVEKLVIAVSAPKVNDIITDCVGHWTELAKSGDHKGLMQDTAERIYSPAYLKKYRKFYPFLGLVGRQKSYDRFLSNAGAILDFDASAELGKIACPTLILGGTDDHVVGAQASHELHERINNSSIYMYDGLGHAAYEEAEDFNERVLAFLR